MDNIEISAQYAIDKSWIVSPSQLYKIRTFSVIVLVVHFAAFFYLDGAYVIVKLIHSLGFWGYFLALLYYFMLFLSSRTLNLQKCLRILFMISLSLNLLVSLVYCGFFIFVSDYNKESYGVGDKVFKTTKSYLYITMHIYSTVFLIIDYVISNKYFTDKYITPTALVMIIVFYIMTSQIFCYYDSTCSKYIFFDKLDRSYNIILQTFFFRTVRKNLADYVA